MTRTNPPPTPLQIALATAIDCARAYALAPTERSTTHESPTLCSDLAYRDARAAVRIARLITSQVVTPNKPNNQP